MHLRSAGRFTAHVAEHVLLLGCLSGLCSSMLSCRLRKELFKVLEQVRCRVEKLRYLRVNILNRLGLTLISLQNLKELLVDVWLGCKPVLHLKLAGPQNA